MSTIHRLGFTRLLREEGDEAQSSLNVIFVHGLRGHPRATWETTAASIERNSDATKWHKSFKPWAQSKKARFPSTRTAQVDASPSPDVFWPKQFLASDIPQAIVWTYGYNADVIGGLFQADNKNSISQHGRDLAVRLERELENEEPIAFVVHSLGGIIVKDAIRRSEKIRERTKLIIFLGTPHRGSTYADWGRIASNLARVALQDSNKEMLKTLQVNNEVLDNIHEEFKTIVFKGKIKVHSFQEARGISGIKGLDEKVVSDFSSKLDLPSALETVESIDANHIQMTRYNSREDQGYRAICGVLRGFIEYELGNHRIVPAHVADKSPARAFIAEETIQDTSKYDITAIYYMPFVKNRYFVGREDELNMLKQKLMVDRDCQKISVVGLGGAGKTQVALQFAYLVKETWPDYSIFWVPALSIETFEQACMAIAKKLGIFQAAGQEEDIKELVKQHLSAERAGKWLLVVDNADDRDILFGRSQTRGLVDYLPQSEEGVVLFTTRILEVAGELTRSDVLELGAMNQQDAISFLSKSLMRKNLLCDSAATADLLDELVCLPLAITQAAAYLNRNRISISEYLRLLHNSEQDIFDLTSKEFRDDTRYKGTANAVATTWVVSFNQIRTRDKVAADLLSFISCIEWKAIPRSILPSVQSEVQMTGAIGILCAYSFLVRRGDEDWYDIHRLVHLAARMWIKQHGDEKEVIERAIQHVTSIFPSDDYENRERWRAYLPHALRLLEDRQACDIDDMSDLALWIGRCLREDGKITEAVRWLEESCKRRAGLNEEDSNRLSSQHALAAAYEADGQIKKAVKLLEQVVTVREKVLAEDHHNRLASQHALATAYRADGQIKKAVELLEQVITIRKKVLAEDHHNRLASQHELAGAYQANGQTKKALELLEQVVIVKEKVLAEDHPSRLASQHELATAYRADGQIKKAVELLEQVVTVEKVLAEDHPSRLASQHALAMVYQADGQVTKAVTLLEQVVATKKRVFRVDHPSRIVSEKVLRSWKAS